MMGETGVAASQESGERNPVALLDCSSREAALASLARGFGTTGDELVRALRSYEDNQPTAPGVDPSKRLPREVADHFGVDLDEEIFGGALYFHGTRLLEAHSVKSEGLLSLVSVVERLWDLLFDLLPIPRSAQEWAGFREWVEAGGGGQDGRHYRNKSANPLHHGPCAYLVRDVLVEPGPLGQHNYLRCPEIVEDLARCYSQYQHVDLQALFCEATQPVIVTFRSHEVGRGRIEAALWYAYERLHGLEISGLSVHCLDRRGTPVPPADIVNVETHRAAYPDAESPTE